MNSGREPRNEEERKAKKARQPVKTGAHKFRKAFAGAAIPIIISFPIASNASSINRPHIPLPGQNPAPVNNPGNQQIPAAPALDFDGGTMQLAESSNGLELAYERDGERKSIILNTLPQEVTGRMLAIHYGEERTAIVYEKYAMFTLGAMDLAQGRTTLPGNDFLNSFFVVITAPPLSSSFTEDALFLFYGDGEVTVLKPGNNTARLSEVSGLEGVSEKSTTVRVMGMYIFVQAGAIPVGALSLDLSYYSPFDYTTAELGEVLRIERRASGFSAFFSTPGGTEIELEVSVGTSGDVDSVRVVAR
jgi:hypothetical protein